MAQTRTEIDILLKARADLAGLNQAKGAVAGVHREIKDANAGFSRFAGLARSALGSLGVGFSVAGLTAGIKSVIDYGSRITDLATQSGTSTDAFQTLAIVAKDAGVAQDQLATSLAHLRKTISEAATSASGEGAKAFRALGLEARALAQLPIERAFEVVARAVANAEDKTAAYGYALDILGSKNAPRLQEVLSRLATEGFDKLAESTKSLRISPADLKTLDDAGDKLERMYTAAKVQGSKTVIAAVGPKDGLAQRSEWEKMVASTTDVLTILPRILGYQTRFASSTEEAAAATSAMASDSARIERSIGASAVSAKDFAEAFESAQKFAADYISEKEKMNAEESKATLSLNERAAKLGEEQKRFALEKLIPLDRAIELNREMEALIREQGQVVGADNASFAKRLDYEERILDIRTELAGLRKGGVEGMLEDVFGNLDKKSAELARVKDEVRELDKMADELGWAFQSAFEDAILEGKKLSEVLKGLAKDILKMIVRQTITQPIANWISSAIMSWGGRASGGPVAGGQAYIVGERGPELFMPSVSGSIVPNDALTASPASASGETFVFNQYFQGGVTRGEMAQIIPQIVEASKAAVIDGRRRRQPGFA